MERESVSKMTVSSMAMSAVQLRSWAPSDSLSRDRNWISTWMHWRCAVSRCSLSITIDTPAKCRGGYSRIAVSSTANLDALAVRRLEVLQLLSALGVLLLQPRVQDPGFSQRSLCLADQRLLLLLRGCVSCELFSQPRDCVLLGLDLRWCSAK